MKGWLFEWRTGEGEVGGKLGQKRKAWYWLGGMRME